jgi:hypothetical protein
VPVKSQEQSYSSVDETMQERSNWPETSGLPVSGRKSHSQQLSQHPQMKKTKVMKAHADMTFLAKAEAKLQQKKKTDKYQFQYISKAHSSTPALLR